METGNYFASRLDDLGQKFAFVTEVRGRGLLLAMEFDREIARSVLTSCLERGLLVNKVKPVALRFMPPLIVSRDEVDEAIAILDQVLSLVES